MDVVDAVCMSISVPFLFSAYKHTDGMFYLDGGTFEYVPIGAFIGKKNEDIAVVKISQFNEIQTPITGFKTFFLRFFMNMLANSAISYRPEGIAYAEIDVGKNTNLFDFGMKEDDIIRLFLLGQTAAVAMTPLIHSGFAM
jgi:predicted acylesterase/phospholipase RssA